MFNGKIDQIAFISRGEEDTQRIMETLGLQDADWTEDFCVAEGFVRGAHGVRNRARLLFNYDMGIEVEILEYLSGANYAEDLTPGSICHYGIHANAEGLPPIFDAPIIQQVETQEHTNPFLLERGRRYRYTIYDTYDVLGVYTKVIERIEAAS